LEILPYEMTKKDFEKSTFFKPEVY
jgi:hypothetical protein